MYQEQGIWFHYMVSNVVDHLPNHTLLQVAAFLFREHHNSTQQSKTVPSYTTFSIPKADAYYDSMILLYQK